MRICRGRGRFPWGQCWWALYRIAGESKTQKMSALVGGGERGEDLGAILARVQDDLQLIRTAVARAGEDAVDREALESVLSRTERGIQVASRQVLSSSLDHVTTLPPVYQQQSEGSGSSRGRGPSRRRGRSESHKMGLLEMAEHTSRHSPIHQARHYSLSAAEETQLMQRARLVMTPSLPATRKLLSQHYSLPETREARSLSRSKVRGKVYSGGTVPPLTTLPQRQRNTIVSTPPTISEDDAHKGLLSLIERQLIPPAADIVLDPPPVKSTTLELLSASQQHARATVAVAQDGCGHMVGVRLAPDHVIPASASESRQEATPTTPQSATRQPRLNFQLLPVPNLFDQSSEQKTEERVPPPLFSPPVESLQIIIENGLTLTATEDYQKFQSSNPQQWTHISAVIGLLEKLCKDFAVPTAIVNCKRVVELSLETELCLRLRRGDLLACLFNQEEVSRVITRPGQRFRGQDGQQAAASLIQATYRMYSQRKKYLSHLRRVWAVDAISKAWSLCIARHSVRRNLVERRERELKCHRLKISQLAKRWRDVQENKRVIIHLPSLGHPLWMRGTETEIKIEQSLQLGRITDVEDPNVEVVYISPVSLDQEILDYYGSLLATGPSGSQSAMERVHIVTPDVSLPPHPLPLSSLLTLNPRTVQRIKRLTAGREAYIIPGAVNPDDITVADMLGVPLLGTGPEASQLYGSKDGARKLFKEANVVTPPCVPDIVSENQLVDQLTGLVATHPLIRRWIFKLPHHSRGRGFAYCDVGDHLECHRWLVRESQRYGLNWSTLWAQEGARRRILLELPAILELYCRPVDTELYPNWRAFLADFLVNGGLIEGHPPSPSVTALTVDLFIDPRGDVTVVSTQDQICGEEYVVWGVSVPQTSVPPDLLLTSALRVGVAASGRGILGHISVDFVTFINPTSLVQELWAVDLDIGYSSHLALLRLLCYVTGATVDPRSGQLVVDGGPRFAVLSPRVYHSSLPVVHYPVFFQMCKANHIGYDAKVT
ncbi:IQ domain-containing protein H [Geodia barretti]|uniref:IQ domain-containing protein H n=1 Tax=Geodia barretti TaxID=519541 RepID=A0AA35TSB4_GEOBA|nr:IQ domain-containing protein H [Geodia barretti]